MGVLMGAQSSGIFINEKKENIEVDVSTKKFVGKDLKNIKIRTVQTLLAATVRLFPVSPDIRYADVFMYFIAMPFCYISILY
jgi:hypothetical protein